MGSNERSVYVGNLAAEVDEELLHELFMQFGDVRSVRVPRDRVSGDTQGYGFVELGSVPEADYVVRVLDGMVLCGRTVRVRGVKARE